MPSRTFHWDDTSKGINAIASISGLEYLNAMHAGELPLSPLVKTLDFKVEHIEKGKVAFSFSPQEFHYNPLGSVHGGVISALLDSAMGCTLHSVLEAGNGYTTLELKTNFLKTITIKTGLLKATGKILHIGSRTALLEAEITDDAGKIYAHGTSTCMILKH
jgi:uncharacterized protein (TIGR00369 family)